LLIAAGIKLTIGSQATIAQTPSGTAAMIALARETGRD
jgi:hypothetical protein